MCIYLFSFNWTISYFFSLVLIVNSSKLKYIVSRMSLLINLILYHWSVVESMEKSTWNKVMLYNWIVTKYIHVCASLQAANLTTYRLYVLNNLVDLLIACFSWIQIEIIMYWILAWNFIHKCTIVNATPMLAVCLWQKSCKYLLY